MDTTGSTAAVPGPAQAAARQAVAWGRAVLSGYAQIYFSSSPVVGAVFLVATFLLPDRGLYGLAGLVLANASAVALGFPRDHVRSGFYAYNGLLQGLAVGLSYELSTASFALLLVTSFLGVIIATVCRSVSERYLGVPVLSLPFVLTIWVVVAAAKAFADLTPKLNVEEARWLAGVLPWWAEYFVRSLGAPFFQLNVPAGILVALGLLIYSRHAFILAIVGLVSGTLLHVQLGGELADLRASWAGFNFALTAIAVGGIWLVPSAGSLLLAAASAAVCALVTSASNYVLWTFGLPALAFPFVVTTAVILHALTYRPQAAHLVPILFPADSPEANVKGNRNIYRRLVTHDKPVFSLPVSGSWTITQGWHGSITHQGVWAQAWDFEVLDEQGVAYAGTGTRREDYHAFHKPVFAPAAGKVVKIIDDIEDNEVGQVNLKENWGNLVVLWHHGWVYSVLCHLAKGSAAVQEGEWVRQGQKLGLVGNSGRSPVPHLHFQAQLSHEVGAPTTPAEFVNYVVESGETRAYQTHAVPAQGERVRLLDVDLARQRAASFPLGQEWRYQCVAGKRRWTETWRSEIDALGNRSLCCVESGARLYLYADRSLLLFLSYTGPRDAALRWLFLALPRLPLTATEVTWADTVPADLGLSAVRKVLFDLVEPVTELARLSTASRFVPTPRGLFRVQTELSCAGPLAPRSHHGLTLSSTFDPWRGLDQLTVSRADTETIQVTLSHDPPQTP